MTELIDNKAKVHEDLIYKINDDTKVVLKTIDGKPVSAKVYLGSWDKDKFNCPSKLHIVDFIIDEFFLDVVKVINLNNAKIK